MNNFYVVPTLQLEMRVIGPFAVYDEAVQYGQTVLKEPFAVKSWTTTGGKNIVFDVEAPIKRPTALERFSRDWRRNLALIEALPERWREQIAEYVMDGKQLENSLLHAAFANDFKRVMDAFDDEGITAGDLGRLKNFLFSSVPSGCQGSLTLYNKWTEKGGYGGMTR